MMARVLSIITLKVSDAGLLEMAMLKHQSPRRSSWVLLRSSGAAAGNGYYHRDGLADVGSSRRVRGLFDLRARCRRSIVMQHCRIRVFEHGHQSGRQLSRLLPCSMAR